VFVDKKSDVQYGSSVPVKSTTIRLPSSNKLITERTRTFISKKSTLKANGSDPGKTFTTVLNRSANTLTITTPAARTATAQLDGQGRIATLVSGVTSNISYSYDANGRGV
jgi:hypothetical protein